MEESQANFFRAELKVVLAVLRIALPPLCVHVDNAQVVQGFTKGSVWCPSSKSCAADLRRSVWDLHDGIERVFTVVEVKAHTFWWDVMARCITARDGRATL